MAAFWLLPDLGGCVYVETAYDHLAAMLALGSNCITVAAERDQGHSQQLQQSAMP